MSNIVIRREQDLPATSSLLSETDFLARTGLAEDRLQELVQLEWLHLVRTSEAMLYRAGDVCRARKLERLCCDFELPVLGAAIVVDLLERIDALEQEVRSLRGRV